MGYYTDYNLSIHSGVVHFEGLVEILEEISGYEWDLNVTNSAWMNGKWYDHDEHMVRLSKMFPDVTFQLDGEGEESGDIWRAWYKNGWSYCTKAKIVLDSFDETKLQLNTK
jgi:hypothetical protein